MMEYKTFELTDGTFMEGIPEEKDDSYHLFNVIKGKLIVEKNKIVSMKQTNNEFQISVLDGLQLAYKVTCNSLYGQVGATTSPLCYKELAACTTATGRRMVITARDLTLNTFVGAKLTYGDSVTEDTPLMVMKNGFIDFIEIKDLNNEWVEYNNFKIDPYKKCLGLIAQEVELIIPEVVSENEVDNIKCISYGSLIGVLIEAIKEQQKQINDLKNISKNNNLS